MFALQGEDIEGHAYPINSTSPNRIGMFEGKARFIFHLASDLTTFITANKIAEEDIGFDLGCLLNLLKAAGFDNIKHCPGGWTGNTSAIAGQDILICEKVK